MAVKRGRIAGSALVTALLGLLLVRGPSSEPAALPEPNHATPPSLLAEEKHANESRTKAERRALAANVDRNSTGILREGPWTASNKHFSGRVGPDFDLLEYANLVSRPEDLLKYANLVLPPDIERWGIRGIVQVHSMIAMVPNPIETHLALAFDRTIEAIESAASSMNCVIDHYWLPWDIEPKTDWASYDSLIEARADREQKASEPGLLMFRCADGNGNDKSDKARLSPEALLYVFIVSETPTAGINSGQFKKAVEYIHQTLYPYHEDGIRVLGPITSGSVAPLRRLISALQEWPRGDKQPQPTFTIYSGTVSTEWDQNTFDDFQRFVHPFSKALESTVEMLQGDHHIKGKGSCQGGEPEVAILVEGETTLGGKLPRDIAPDKRGCYDWFGYPREIASLRNAYKASTLQSPAAGNNPAGRQSLSPNLTDLTNSSDAPPDFSKGQSAFSQEAVLMNFAAEMQRRHYRYIGIIGSNELDSAFLVTFLRNAVPDAGLFLMDSDLLLQHEPDNVPYIGTFSITTYPLLNPQLTAFGQGISRGDSTREPTRLPFPSQFEVGSFDAAVCLISDMLNDHEGAKLELAEREDCPPKQTAQDLPLWLTVLGVGGNWPIEVLKLKDPPVSKSESRAYSSPELEDLPFSWQALCAVLYVVAGYHVLILLGGWPFSPKFRDFILGTIAPFRRLLAIQTASATLALALLLTGFSPWKASWYPISAGFLLGALSLLCLFRRWWCVWTPRARKMKRSHWVWIPLGIVIPGLILTAVRCENRITALRPLDLWTMATGFLIGALFATCWLLTWEYRNLKKKCRNLNKMTGWFPRSGPSPPLRQRIGSYFQQSLGWQIAAFFLPWLAASGAVFMWSSLVCDDQSHYGAFFSYRAVHLASAVSPLAPLILLLTVFYLAATFYVWRLRFDDKVRPKLYSDQDRQRMKKETKDDHTKEEDKLRPGLRSELLIVDAVNNDWKNLLYSFTIFATWFLLFHPLRFELFERPRFQKLYSVLFCLVILLILISGFRLNRIWDRLRRFLLDLNRQRIKAVFPRLKDQEWSSIWFYGAEDADWDFMHRSHEVVQELLERVRPRRESLEADDKVNDHVAEVQRQRWKLPKQLGDWSLGKLVLNQRLKRNLHAQESKFSAAQNSLAQLLLRTLDRLATNWTLRPRFLFMREVEAKPDLRGLLDQYLALRWENFIRAVIARIRLLIIFLAVSFSLALLSLGIYAFEPHRDLIWSVTALFIATGFIIMKVMVQIHHDPIIRMIIGAESREFLGLEFYVRIAALGIAPLLTLLATHFPGIAHYVVSYLQPGLEALK